MILYPTQHFSPPILHPTPHFNAHDSAISKLYSWYNTHTTCSFS